MKRLFVIRHAKSDHGPQYKSDFDRPLNHRGRADAARMADELKKTGYNLDQFLVSTAKRTRETAAYFTDAFGLDNSRISYSDTLYLPREENIWKAVNAVKDDYENVALFTHNPAAEYILHHFHPGVNLPTCSIIELHFDLDKWNEINPQNARFISHKYPKMYD